MKTIQSLIVAAVLFAGSSVVALAGPGIQYWQTLHNEAQLKDLKPGDKIAYICNQCQSVNEKTIESTAEAMDLCKEGATVMCPSCKQTVKLVTQGPPKNSTSSREVSFVNDKGEACFFIAKVIDKP